MSIFSFVGFYYSLAQARITNAFEKDFHGAKRKYTLIKILWIGMFALSVYFDVNFMSVLLFLITIAAAPLLLSLESLTKRDKWGGISADAERFERERRLRILKRIDKRDSAKTPGTTKD